MGAQDLLPQLVPQGIGFFHLRHPRQFVYQFIHQFFQRGLEIPVLLFSGGVGELFREVLQHPAEPVIFQRAGLYLSDQFLQRVSRSRAQLVSAPGLFLIDGGQFLPEDLACQQGTDL